jgi:hypothetical protein
MSKELAERLFGTVKASHTLTQSLAPGLNLEAMVSQIGGRLKQAGVQGTMELASALFSGHGFVPYGPGQDARMAQQSMQRGRSM